MLYELYSNLAKVYGEKAASRILAPGELPVRFYIPTESEAVRLNVLDQPFEIIKSIAQDKQIALDEIATTAQHYIANKPVGYKLGYFYHEDHKFKRAYAQVHSYSFRQSPPKWLSFSGTVDVQQCKGYQKVTQARSFELKPQHFSASGWQVIKNNVAIQSAPQDFAVEFDQRSVPFNCLDLSVHLGAIAYVTVYSITADELELLTKPVMLSDRVRILCPATTQSRLTVRFTVPTNVWARQINTYRIELGECIQTLNSYESTFTLNQRIEPKFSNYTVALLCYELAESTIQTDVFVGADRVATFSGSFEYDLAQVSSEIRIVSVQTNSEYDSVILRQVFVGGNDT